MEQKRQGAAAAAPAPLTAILRRRDIMADEIVRVIVKDAPVKAMAITAREMA